ncbi:conserved hypothetical protein [Gammaproteobacteria bacterium]
MKIQSSEMILSGQHAETKKYQRSESLRVWTNDRSPENRNNQVTDRFSLSSRAQRLRSEIEPEKSTTEAVDSEKSLASDPKSLLICLMVEAMTGKKIRITSVEHLPNAESEAPTECPQPPREAPPPPSPPQESFGYGAEYNFHESYSESEQSDFSAQGVVRTSDGKEIEFMLEASLSRNYSTQTDTQLRLGDAAKKDPLILYFGGTSDLLSSSKFNFDLDADGKAEKISCTSQNSGFLALDQNKDGVINNGSELFGPSSGEGFQELAKYDQDQNGWIDENDSVFEQLKIWKKGESEDTLVTLKSAGVGALYLGKVSTAFQIENGADGFVRSSSVYLNENGSAGALRQVDLTV